MRLPWDMLKFRWTTLSYSMSFPNIEVNFTYFQFTHRSLIKLKQGEIYKSKTDFSIRTEVNYLHLSISILIHQVSIGLLLPTKCPFVPKGFYCLILSWNYMASLAQWIAWRNLKFDKCICCILSFLLCKLKSMFSSSTSSIRDHHFNLNPWRSIKSHPHFYKYHAQSWMSYSVNWKEVC